MSQFSDTAGDLSPSLQGFFVASILLSASASSLASGVVAERISRRYGIAVGAAIFALASIVCAAGQNFAMLQVARLITGIGAGQMISVASIYLVEIAPAQARGKLVCMLQFAITVGLMTGYFLCYGTSMINSSLQWRLPFALSAVLSLALCFATLFLVPFSPRWLAQNGREDQALSTLRQLRLSAHSGRHHRPGRYGSEDELLLLELDGIKAAIAESRRLNASSASFRELFNRRYRSRSLLGITLMAFQQLSGVDVILYFAPIVFASVFTSQEGAFLASGGLGIVAVVSTIPTQIWADQWGRKPPMVAGGLSMAACYIVIGSLFARFGQHTSSGVRLTGGSAKWVIVVGIYVFLAIFSCTWAVATRIYASEIMPTKLRSRAAALQQLAKSVVLLSAIPFPDLTLMPFCLVIAHSPAFAVTLQLDDELSRRPHCALLPRGHTLRPILLLCKHATRRLGHLRRVHARDQGKIPRGDHTDVRA